MTEKTETFQDKLFTYRQKQRKSLFIKVSIICGLLVMIALYVLLPFSRVSSYSLVGNKNINSDQILEIVNLKRSTSLFVLNTNEIEEKLNNHPLISNAKVNATFGGLTISIDESAPYLKNSQNKVYMTKEVTPLVPSEQDWYNDEIVGDTLKETLEVIPTLLNDDISNSEISYFGDVYYEISKEYRSKIKYYDVSIDDKNIPYMNCFVEVPDFDELLNVQLPFLNKKNTGALKAIAYALDEESYTRWKRDIFTSSVGFDLLKSTKKTTENFSYYSIKVIIEETNGTYYYGIYAGDKQVSNKND
jgi:cell division protein FtsQ